MYIRDVVVPPLEEQRAIARVLGTLDDKIEINRILNERFEAIARAIFKSWFANSTNDFRGEWRRGKLGDLAIPAGETVNPANVDPASPYIGLEHMPRRSVALSSWEGAGKVTSGKISFRRGDFLFGKLRPYFHKVGIAPVDGICSTDIVVLRAIESLMSSFVLCCISSAEFVSYTDRTSTGTKMPRTNWGSMSRYEMPIPPEAVMKAFHDAVWPFFKRIIAGVQESRTLAQIRDLLIRKFISGELQVKDADCVVAEAAA